jgi:hypothetical protein
LRPKIDVSVSLGLLLDELWILIVLVSFHMAMDDRKERFRGSNFVEISRSEATKGSWLSAYLVYSVYFGCITTAPKLLPAA